LPDLAYPTFLNTILKELNSVNETWIFLRTVCYNKNRLF